MRIRKGGKRIHFIHFEWRHELYHTSCNVTEKFGSINWWCYWNSKTRNKKRSLSSSYFEGTYVCYDFFIIKTVASSLIKRTLGTGVRERQEGGILPLLSTFVVKKYLWKRSLRAWKGVMTAGIGYNNMDYMDKNSLVQLYPIRNIEITKYFNYEPESLLKIMKDVFYFTLTPFRSQNI